MTEFEDREDAGVEESAAQENAGEENATEEDAAQVRELFGRTVTEDRPRLGFTPDDLVLGGRRRVRRRRVAAVLAGTASVAVVAVAATAFAGGTGTASPASNASRDLADAKLANAAFAKLFSELDLGGHHLTMPVQKRSVDFFLNSGGGLCNDTSHVLTSYAYGEEWTADGKSPFPSSAADVPPFVNVDVRITVPGGQEGQFSGMGWGTITRVQLSDGSVVASASASGGRHLQVTRTLSDKRQIVISVLDSSVAPMPQGQPEPAPTEPFPYTLQQLGTIVGGLSLPLPFADGYQPQGWCGTAGQ